MQQESSVNQVGRNANVHASKGKQQQFIEPILLMDSDENGKFFVSKKAIKFLSEIETNIAVISIAGQYRTGKSFLLNRFAGQQKGFAIGPSTNPCTKGIWIWGQPIKISDDLTIILLDTEGLNSYQRDENIDARLFVLTCLLSSTIIYNIMNVIDERAIENLSFMTNMSRHVSQDVHQYLPNFVWVIRDFSLELKETDDQNPAYAYMENALRFHEGDSVEVKQKNDVNLYGIYQIRMAIIKYFKQRDCYTLVRPVNDEKLLRQIDTLNYSDLKKEFRQQTDHLVRDIISKAQPKVICNAALNGRHFSELIATYVQTMNSQGIPSITNAWERIVDKEYRKLKEQLTKNINDFVINEIQPNQPIAPEIIYSSMNRKQQIIFKLPSSECQELILNFKLSYDRQILALKQLKQQFDDITSTQIQENHLKSKKINNIISNKMIEVLTKATETQKYQNISIIVKECQTLKKIYFQEAQQPTSHEVYVNNFVENVLRIIERVYNNMKLEEQTKIEQLHQQIGNLQAKNEAITKILKEEKENLNNQIEQVKKIQSDERIQQEKRYQELQSQNKKDRFRPIQDEKSLFGNTEGFIKTQKLGDEIEIMKELQDQLANVSDQISEIKNSQNDFNKEKLELYYEKQYQKVIKEAKKEYENQNERQKISYDAEAKVLKEDRLRLDEIREQLQIALVEKDCEVKLLKERIKGYEKQKSKEVEHADMMCKISEQMLKVMRKIENH